MSTTTQRPTPETDDFIIYAVRTDHNWRTFARKLERERDEALAKLSTVYRWIERNHPDGFIDSQSHLQNLDRVADAWHDKLEATRDERDQLSRDLSSLLAGDCLNGHDAVEGVRNGIAMREAIREACDDLITISAHDGPGFPHGTCATFAGSTLAKLQPFLKP